MLDSINIVLLIVSLVSLVAFGFLLASSFKRSVLWGLGVLLVPFVTLFYGYKFWPEVKKPFLAYVGSNVVSLIIGGYIFTQLGGMQAIEMAGKINDGSLTEQDAAQFMMGAMDGMEKLGGGGKEEMLAQMRADPNLSEEDIKQFEAMFGQIEAVATGAQESIVEGDWQKQGGKAPLQLATESTDETKTRHIDAKIAEFESKMAKIEGSAQQEALAAASGVSALGFPEPQYVESPIKKTVADQFVKKGSGAISVADAGHYIGDVVSVTSSEGVTRRATLVSVQPDSLEFQRRASGGTLTFHVRKSEVSKLNK